MINSENSREHDFNDESYELDPLDPYESKNDIQIWSINNNNKLN